MRPRRGGPGWRAARAGPAAAAAALLACAPPDGGPGAEGAAGDALDAGALPARFEGLLPCADCPGIATTLVLRPDSVFLLESVYRGAPAGMDSVRGDVGLWRRRGDVLELRGGTAAAPRFFGIEEGGVRMLDVEGHPIDSELPYRLPRADGGDTLARAVALRGAYTYLADAARLRECASGLDLPVAPTDGAEALERAYLEAGGAPGAPALVEVRARPLVRPAMEGPPREHWVVEGLAGPVRPDRGCPAGGSGSPGPAPGASDTAAARDAQREPLKRRQETHA